MGAFTGRRRERTTRRTVAFMDVASKWVITLGGIGTIAAVCVVGLFLFWTVLPLFERPTVRDRVEVERLSDHAPLHLAINEYQRLGWVMYPDQSVIVFDFASGEILDEHELFGDKELTTSAFTSGGEVAVFGFADGTVQPVNFVFANTFYEAEDMPEGLRGLEVGKAAPYLDGVVERTPEGQFRFQQLKVEVEDVIDLDKQADSPVRLLDVTVPTDGGTAFVALTEDGKLWMERQERRKNLLTGEVRETWRAGHLDDPGFERDTPPDYVKLSGLSDSAIAIWRDGHAVRFATRRLSDIYVTERFDITEDPESQITAVRWLLGHTTLIVGESDGDISGWFRVNLPPEEVDQLDAAGERTDGTAMILAHELPRGPAAVTALGISNRTRVFVSGYADGTAAMFLMTSDDQLLGLPVADDKPVLAVTITPKDDGVVALTDDSFIRWEMDMGHPQATVSAIFGRVRYEGYAEPQHKWQSSAGHQGAEPKYGLMPLVFGTIKATIYSMIFGTPLALLAAIYTSEFMHPRVKSTIKPTIELMASLPSVVLGFIAGLVIAPFVKDLVPAVLAGFAAVPLSILAGAYLWQLLPKPAQLQLQNIGVVTSRPQSLPQWAIYFFRQTIFRLGGVRLMAMGLLLIVGVLIAIAVGPRLQQVMFAGDLKLWLSWQGNTTDPELARFAPAWGGWTLVLLPLCGLAVALFVMPRVNHWMRGHCGGWSRRAVATFDLAKFASALLGTFMLAALIGLVLDLIGFDPRGSLQIWGADVSPMGTYVQRNALIVGFVMGFAIIPIIYTIAEDALSTVPEHLRSASLGTGATPWQTAVRIIMPTAASGLFSAVMIGLGRAVGETMIVLMAAGNTSIMEMNIFNGFQTLSAGIATELPEAAKDSTHYRILFLAALTLFVMTFVLNTFAEAVRQRFRKRAIAL